MLSNRLVMPSVPAADLERAKAWYAEKLGLKPSMEMEAGAMYETADGTGFLLYPTPAAGQSPNTLMAFSSTDIDADVAALKQRGVVFEDIDTPELKTVNSVATIGGLKSGWFRDSEGNILCISTMPS